MAATVLLAPPIQHGASQDPFVQFKIKCSDLEQQLDVFYKKMQALPLNDRRAHSNELNDLTFLFMDLEESATEEVYLSTIPKAKELVVALKRRIDELGVFIAGAAPVSSISTIRSIVDAATFGVFAGIGTVAAKALASRSARIKLQDDQQIDSDESLSGVLGDVFDQISVHHDVGTRDQFIIRSNVYQIEGGRTVPLKMGLQFLNPSRNPQKDLAPMVRGDINQFLESRGLQLAPADLHLSDLRGAPQMDSLGNSGAIVLCKHKIRSSDLENQKNRVVEAQRSLQEAERARDEVRETLKRAKATVGDHCDFSIGISKDGPYAELNLDKLGTLRYYDCPEMNRIAGLERDANTRYNQALQNFGAESARYSNLRRRYDKDHGNGSWFDIFIDFSKGTFGFLVNFFSSNF